MQAFKGMVPRGKEIKVPVYCTHGTADKCTSLTVRRCVGVTVTVAVRSRKCVWLSYHLISTEIQTEIQKSLLHVLYLVLYAISTLVLGPNLFFQSLLYTVLWYS